MRLSTIKHSLSAPKPSRMGAFVAVYRWPMKKLIGRLNDWRHERHIQFLRAQFKAAYAAGDKERARHLWSAVSGCVMSRSPEQAARIERALHRRLGML